MERKAGPQDKKEAEQTAEPTAMSRGGAVPKGSPAC